MASLRFTVCPSRPTSLKHLPIPAPLELQPIHRCISCISETQLLSSLGPRSICSAQQVRHVPSPQGVSQHEQEGPGSSGVKTSGAAGAPGMSDTHTHCQTSQSAQSYRAGLPYTWHSHTYTAQSSCTSAACPCISAAPPMSRALMPASCACLG